MLRKTSLKIDEMPFDVGLCSDKSLMYATHGIVPHRTVGIEDTNHLQNFRANSVFQKRNSAQSVVGSASHLVSCRFPVHSGSKWLIDWRVGSVVENLLAPKNQTAQALWFHPEVVVFPEIDVFVATFSDALIRLCCERRDAGCFSRFSIQLKASQYNHKQPYIRYTRARTQSCVKYDAVLNRNSVCLMGAHTHGWFEGNTDVGFTMWHRELLCVIRSIEYRHCASFDVRTRTSRVIVSWHRNHDIV